MAKKWTEQEVLDMGGSFQPACVLTAAAELGVFDALAEGPMTAEDLAQRLGADLRATTMLADVLTAMALLAKQDGRYSPAGGVVDLLTATGPDNVLAMVRHQANCLRSWAQLAEVVMTGTRAERKAGIRGAAADLEAFIEAMNDVSRTVAPGLVADIGPLTFSHLLDLGGGPGTWTIEFLKAVPDARATLFDLPDVIPIAKKHIAAAGLADRVTFAPGDFDKDAKLPAGADLAWVSAIIHMNSRQENRDLFAKVYAALAGGGQIMIRDIVMEESRIAPPGGAFFAINMLVNTPAGGTYTFDEVAEDLRASGFENPTLLQAGQFMDSVIRAEKP